MRLNVAELKDEVGGRLRVPLEVPHDLFVAGPDPVHVRVPFRGHAAAVNIDDAILVSVHLRGEAELECGRCLVRYNLPLALDFDEEFRAGEVKPDQDPAEQLEDDDRPYSLYQGDEIDLTEVVRQHLLLALPMKPLCQETCRGLCPRCGKNLNEGDCGCVVDEIDPRLEGLKNLLKGDPLNS